MARKAWKIEERANVFYLFKRNPWYCTFTDGIWRQISVHNSITMAEAAILYYVERKYPTIKYYDECGQKILKY